MKESNVLAEVVPKGETLRGLGSDRVLVTLLPPLFSKVPKMWLYAIGCVDNSSVLVFAGAPFTQDSADAVAESIKSMQSGMWESPAGYDRHRSSLGGSYD